MADEVKEPVDIGAMSDEDFLNLNSPEDAGIPASEVEENNEQQEEEQNAEGNEAEEANEAKEGEEAKEDEGEAAAKEGADAEGTEGKEGKAAGDKQSDKEGTEGGDVPPKAKEPKGKKGAEAPESKGAVSPVGSKEEKQAEAVAEPEQLSAEDFQKLVMAPFKANGKTIELKDPKEVIQLMQMGANYTRKMQDIQPHRKVLTMLQNNDLLDEGKLDLLIAVSKKDPEAIKKIIKDAGIDPLDIDTASEPTYVEGSHLVSDNEVSFNTAVQDLVSAEGGTETLQHIRTTWDQASKDALWKEPSLMEAINLQRQTGVYDLIANEVARLQTLGSIPPETPFIRAYQAVGEHLAKSGATVPTGKTEGSQEPGGKTVVQPNPTPVARKAAIPKAKVDNSDRAGAAASSRTSAKPAKSPVNYLAMSDEEFEKIGNFQGRI